MPAEKTFDIRKLTDELYALPAKAFLNPNAGDPNPYRMVEAAGAGNPLRLRKCLDVLREVIWQSGEDFEDRLQAMVDRIPCRGGEIVRLIEDALWFECGSVQLRSLQCGMGKSTAISYVIRDVIEHGDGMGILIATDSIERLKSYLTPRFDPELAAFLKAHESSITLIESANKVEALQRMRTSPVLLMTTQRYFGMSVAEINDILHGSGIQRDAVIIDERPIIKTVETVSRTDVNMVASALSDGLRSYDNHEEKRWMINFWEELRGEFMKAVQDYEDKHIGETPFFAKCAGIQGIAEPECREFMNAMEMHRNQLRRFDPECLARCERIIDVILHGGSITGAAFTLWRIAGITWSAWMQTSSYWMARVISIPIMTDVTGRRS